MFFCFIGKQKKTATDVVPVRRSQRVYTVVKKTRKRSIGVLKSPQELLVQVETVPSGSSGEMTEVGVKETSPEGHILVSPSDQLNWQNRDSNCGGQLKDMVSNTEENYRLCASHCDMAEKKVNFEMPKMKAAVSTDRVQENIGGVYLPENRAHNMYNLPAVPYVNTIDSIYSARYIPRTRFGFPNEQYGPPIDTQSSPLVSQDRELYNVANLHHSEPNSSQQPMAKFSSHSLNDGVNVTQNQMPINSMRAPSIHKVQNAGNMSLSFEEMSQYSTNSSTDNIGNVVSEYSGNSNHLSQMMDRRRNSVYEPFCDGSGYF